MLASIKSVSVRCFSSSSRISLRRNSAKYFPISALRKTPRRLSYAASEPLPDRGESKGVSPGVMSCQCEDEQQVQ